MYKADWATAGLTFLQEQMEKVKPRWGGFTTSVFEWHDYVYTDDDESEDVNFLYKPTNLSISWYKHVGRGMAANVEECPPDWHVIVSSCLTSL